MMLCTTLCQLGNEKVTNSVIIVPVISRSEALRIEERRNLKFSLQAEESIYM